MGCEPARKGACGDSFIGSFKCSFQSECNSEKECICTVNAQCTKGNNQSQEVVEKIPRSVPTKVKSGTEAKIQSAAKKGIKVNGSESHKGNVSINKKMIHDKTYRYF